MQELPCVDYSRSVRDFRAHVGIDDRGLGALVLLHLRNDVAGDRDGRVAKHSQRAIAAARRSSCSALM